ncbi:MAG: transketolase [Spirochaetales bacterium]|nr:transketolase [Spirochaetales bacterium]
MKIKISIDEIQAVKEKAGRIRRLSLKTCHHAGCGHLGGSFSEADILACLYFSQLHIDPSRPALAERDRFILSKGHSTPGYYAALAAAGYFDESVLETFDEAGSPLQGHPDRMKTPGVDMSTGSLGQGLSVGAGMALAGQMKVLDYYVYVLMGDGEIQEGQVWEAVNFAGFRQIRRLIGIVDCNNLQLSAKTLSPAGERTLERRFEAFGWKTLRCSGHEIGELLSTLREARNLAADGPVMVLADTVKGKGVSFMENQIEWHSKIVSDRDYEKARAELEEVYGAQ